MQILQGKSAQMKEKEKIILEYSLGCLNNFDSQQALHENDDRGGNLAGISNQQLNFGMAA